MVVASKRSGVRWFVLAKMPLIKAGVICSVCLNITLPSHMTIMSANIRVHLYACRAPLHAAFAHGLHLTCIW